MENLIDETKRDLVKTLTDTSSEVIADDSINVNDWENKIEVKNKLDLSMQQNYNESATEMIQTNNAGLLQQMINNNENKELLISERITKQKKQEIDELAKKIQPILDLLLRNYNDNNNDEIKTCIKRRKFKRLIELRKKTESYGKT